MRAVHSISSLFSLVCLAGPLCAEPIAAGTWVEVASVANSQVQLAAKRECALMRKEALQSTGATWRIVNDPFTYQRGNPSAQLCPGSMFYGQPRPASPYSGRSGFLVGPDVVLTAAHGMQNSVQFVNDSFYFVFDWQYEPAKGGMAPPSTEGISNDRVYTASEIVAFGPTLGAGNDLMLIRLDRPVVGDRGFMRVHRSGGPATWRGDPVVTIGHPDGLPAKATPMGSIQTIYPSARYPSGRIELNTTPGIDGSSGSMFYNLRQDMVDSVVTGCWCTTFATTGGCTQLDVCSSAPTSSGPSAYGTGTEGMDSVAQFIPPLELLVSPIEACKHGFWSGEEYERTDTVTVQLSSTAIGNTDVQIQVVPDQAMPRGIQMSATFTPPDGSHRGYLAPGEMGAITMRSTSTGKTPPGLYLIHVVIRDGRWGFIDTIDHWYLVTGREKS